MITESAERARKKAAKHAEKNAAREDQLARERQEARRSLGAAPRVPQKRTIELKHRDTKRAERLEELGDEDPELGPRLDVYRVDGTRIDFPSAFEAIRDLVHETSGGATFDEVRAAVGIELRQPGLLDALRDNPRIEVSAERGGSLKYTPPFGAENRTMLAHVLSRAMPGTHPPVGAPEAWDGIKRSELRAEATYDGIDADIDELLAERRCVRVEMGERPQRDFVLMACPPGAPAMEEVRKLWHAERVPQKDSLQQECLRRRLRTQAEYDARAARRAESKRRAAEAAAAAKVANSRTGVIRKQVNTVDLGV